MEKYEFEKPYEFEGKQYTFLEYDLDKLTGADVSAVKKEYARDGNFSVLPSTDSDFCALILARVTRQPIEFFKALPAREYLKLTQQVANFLMG